MIEKLKESCTGCAVCASSCKIGAIKMTENREGFLYPCVDSNICTSCGLCEKICPVLNKVLQSENIGSYSAYSKNAEIVNQASSGGIFYVLAKKVIKNGGVVYGAAFYDQYTVAHIRVSSESELVKLRGSKYLQSTVQDAYKNMLEDLKLGKVVMFSGTGCQIAGVLKLFAKYRQQILTVEIACHGVPSPKVWRKYVEEMEKRYRSNLEKVSFRDKEVSWRHYSVNMQFANGEKYRALHFDDVYMIGFIKNLFLRPSCHKCGFKEKNKASDIYVGDFWGAKKAGVKNYNHMGTSFVSVFSQKGQELIDSVNGTLCIEKVDYEDIIKNNGAIVKSASPHRYREIFFKYIDKVPVKKLIGILTIKERIPYIKSSIKIKINALKR